MNAYHITPYYRVNELIFSMKAVLYTARIMELTQWQTSFSERYFFSLYEIRPPSVMQILLCAELSTHLYSQNEVIIQPFSVFMTTVLFCRAYKTLAQRLRDSLGCKDLREHKFTYLLSYLLIYIKENNISTYSDNIQVVSTRNLRSVISDMWFG